MEKEVLQTLFGSTKASVLCPSCSPKNQTGEMGIAAKTSQGGLRQGGRHVWGGGGDARVGREPWSEGRTPGGVWCSIKGPRSPLRGQQLLAANTGEMPIVCHQVPVLAGSATLATMGTLILCLRKPASYGKHCESVSSGVPLLPARIAWFLQELPSFVVSVGMLAWQPRSLFGPPGNVLLGLFSAHYFHRLAFSPQSTAPERGLTSRGSAEEWGGARRQVWSSRQGLQAGMPRVGKQQRDRRRLQCPLVPALGCSRWLRGWVGEAGELSLGRSLARALSSPTVRLESACSVSRPHLSLVVPGPVGSGTWGGDTLWNSQKFF